MHLARRPRLAAALALLLACLAPACGDTSADDPAGSGGASDGGTDAPRSVADHPALQRLALRPVDDAPLEALSVVARFDLLEQQDRWVFQADQVTKGRPGGDRSREPILYLRTPERSGAMGLELAGEFDLSTFDELRMVVVAGAPGHAQGGFGRDGQIAAVSEQVPLVISDDGRLVTLQLPPAAAGAPVADTLRVWFSGAARSVGLRHVELVRRPRLARLPDAAGEPQLVTLDSDGRRGVGVSDRRPVRARVRVPEGGATLAFSFARPRASAGADEPGALSLVLEDERGAAALRRSLVLSEADDRWSQDTLALDAWAGQTVTLTFATKPSGAAEECAVVAEPVVFVPGDPRPSVLLVTSDTHRADHIGVAGLGVDVFTPAIDALAAQGVLFSDCLSATNVTNPSHATLMTGVHPRDTGIDRNNMPLGEAAPTLAEAFAAGGWTTYAVVSAKHLGHASSGLGQGFDRMVSPVQTQDAEPVVATAQDWLRDAGERPVFLWLHVFDAHTPYDPPAGHLARYYAPGADPRDAAHPGLGEPAAWLRQHFPGVRDPAYPPAAYAGEVSDLDEALAPLFDDPRFVSGVVALTADHGEALGQHGIHYSHIGLFTDTIHVPLVLRWPGAPAGTRSERPVSHVDLPATLLELAGAPRAGVPGTSFADLDAARPPAPRFALSAHHFSASVTYDGMHLLLWLRDQEQSGQTQAFAKHETRLYDLRADRACEHDLAAERPVQTAELRGRLVDWLRAADERGWAAPASDDPEVLEELAQLGYVASADDTSEQLWEDDACDWCRAYAASR